MSRLPDTNIFVIPLKDRFLVYAPIRGLAFTANAGAVNRLRESCRKRDPGLLDESMRARIGGGEWMFEKDRLYPLSEEEPFAPNRVTLFLHTGCNLRCVYCYAESGERKPRIMKEGVIKAAIDLAFANAKKNNKPLQIGFHGGGEPTLAWEALTGAVNYAKSQVTDHPPGMSLSLVSNGLFSEEKADFIMEHFPGIVLSLDGPPDIHNRQRPKVGGGSSFDDVMRTIEYFRRRSFRFSVRSTITAESVRRMSEMVGFFVKDAGCRNLFFEPAFGCGRAGSTDMVPSYEAFGEEYVRAFQEGRKLGAAVRYSAVRLPFRKLSFCGVARGSFNVTPDALITSCYEVCDADHPLADEFVFGRFDEEEKTFFIDEQKLRSLKKMVVENKPYCDNCFCRWHCAGDCPVRVRGTQVDFRSPSPRCEMNRKILQSLLIELLKDQRV